MSPGLSFFLALLIDGALAGAIYALIALAFVLVYKSSRMINFALGEWIMYGALFAGGGYYSLGLGTAGGILLAAVCMTAFGVLFNAIVVRRLVARPVIALIMVTIGLGEMMRGSAPLLFPKTPSGLPLPIAPEPLQLHGLAIGPEKLAAAAVSIVTVAAVTWAYRHSRTGIALRAIADDPQAASAAGIDVHRQFGLMWAATGSIAAIAGILWSFVAGGGFGVALVGLKIFPIVVIGGLDSLVGTIVAAVLIGICESLGAGYLDPQLGGGFGAVSSYALLILMLLLRPQGIFGRPPARRV
jgi:branched-chain amino acid transport system permease protein